MPLVKHDLRCFCSRKPLLGVYGIDVRGRLYVHCRVYKQNRIYGDWIAYGGEVRLCCRECLRWHLIVISDPGKQRIIMQESPTPLEILSGVETELEGVR